MNSIVGSLGLFLDIIGAMLLFFFGLPPKIDRDGSINIITEQIDEGEKKKAEKYDLIGRSGLILLILGFALQLLAIWL